MYQDDFLFFAAVMLAPSYTTSYVSEYIVKGKKYALEKDLEAQKTLRCGYGFPVTFSTSFMNSFRVMGLIDLPKVRPSPVS